MVYTDDLDGCSILVAEDEALSAIDITSIIEMAGGRVIGPAYSLGQGFNCLRYDCIDCALLDMKLHDKLVFPLADALAERGVPIVFLSAHSLNIAPPHHRERCLVRKPYGTRNLIRAIQAAVAGNRPRGAEQPTAQSA
jgi:DNA-binding response OmpR family regulator